MMIHGQGAGAGAVSGREARGARRVHQESLYGRAHRPGPGGGCDGHHILPERAFPEKQREAALRRTVQAHHRYARHTPARERQDRGGPG